MQRDRNLLTKSALIRSECLWCTIGSVFLFTFLLIQGDYLLDVDAYFHIKISDLMRSQGLVRRLPWMTYSMHADAYVDYHFLYHALQVPFVLLTRNLIAAAKASTVCFSAFTVWSLCFLLKKLRAPYRWFWVLFFLLSSPIFTGRLLFGRGVTLFLGLIFLHLYSIIFRKRWLTGVLSFLAVWTYPGFPILPLLAMLYAVSSLLIVKKREFGALIWTMGGIIAAIVVHPAFPRQFYGFWLELVVHSLGPPGLEPIAEWLPAPRNVIIAGILLPIIALSSVLLSAKRQTPLAACLLVFLILILLSLSVALKPFEYLVPILSLYLGVQGWEKRKVFSGSRHSGSRHSEAHRPVNVMSFMRSHVRSLAAMLVIAAMAFWSAPDLYRRINVQFSVTSPEQEFDVADWLASNTPKDSVIVLSWGVFPQFFYRNSRNRYLFGLNPVYAYGADRDTYLLIRAFFAGTGPEPSQIPSRLGSEYAVLNLSEHSRVLQQLLQTPDKIKVAYRNARYIVLRFVE